MKGAVFVDSSVLVYARKANAAAKQRFATQWLGRLWRSQLGRTSVQVVGETYETLTRKIDPPLAPADAWDYVSALFVWNPQPADVAMARCAHDFEQRYRMSWRHSLIVAAAELQDCATILSADLQHGVVFGSAMVRSPFVFESGTLPAYVALREVTRPYRARGRPKRTSL